MDMDEIQHERVEHAVDTALDLFKKYHTLIEMVCRGALPDVPFTHEALDAEVRYEIMGKGQE